MQSKLGQGWIYTSEIQHKQLIKNSLEMLKIYTHERSWRRGHGGKVYAHRDFFLPIWSRIFLPLSLSLSLSNSLSLLFFFLHFLAHFVCWAVWARLIGVDGAASQRYNGKPNIFDPKIWLFFLLWKPFAPFLYMLESSFSYYYYPAYYRIKWYWNWKIACINLAVKVVQKVLDSNYAYIRYRRRKDIMKYQFTKQTIPSSNH